MADFGAIAPAALGSVTAPTSIVLATPSAVSLPTGSDFARWGAYQAIPLPQANAVIFTHPFEGMRYSMEGGSYRLGLLAPDDGFTATSTGVKASSTLTLGAGAGTLPADGDTFNIGVNIALFRTVTFKTTIDTTSLTTNQVKIGATVAATLLNIQKLIEGTGTQGIEYWDGFQASAGYYDTEYWHTAHGIEVASVTSTTIKIQATVSGTVGNAYRSEEVSDTANTQSWSANPTMSGGAFGTGTDPSSGDYDYALAHFRSVDGALSATSPTKVTLTQDSNYNVSLAAAPSFTTRDATDYNRWLRTLVGAVQLFKVKDTTATSLTDDVSDETLGNKFFRFQYRDELYRPRVSGYPVVNGFGAMWRGRLWTIGASKAANYTEGTASVTLDSASVTMSSAAHVKEDWIGRTFRVASTTTDYLIISVTVASNIIILNQKYKETTNGTASYTITDARSTVDLNFSEAQAPETGTSVNNWPPGNNLTGVTSREIAGGTGVVAMWDTLVVFTRTGVWRVSGNTGAFRLQNIGEGMGCFCGQALQVAGGILYWLGPDGVFAWSGNGDPVCLSKPQNSPNTGIQQTIDSINGDEAPIICSNYNPSNHRIRWWIPVDGSVSNNRCLRFDIQTGRFALHTASNITAAWTIPGPSGTQVTVAGDLAGKLWQLDAGYSDGAYGFEPTNTVSSYTASTRTITVGTSNLPTSGDGLAGVPVVIYRPSTGAYEMAKIASNTSSTIVLFEPPTTTPTSSYSIVVGGIPLDCLSGDFHDNHPELPKWIEAMTLAHEVESAATEVWVGAGSDNADPSIYPVGDKCDMTETDGEHHFWLRTPRGRSLKFRILSFARGYRVRLRGYTLSVRAQGLAEVEG